MPKLHLEVTEYIDGNVVSILESRLGSKFEIGKYKFVSRNSVDEIPQYIALIASTPFWTALSVAGALFCKKLIELSAEDFYDATKRKFKKASDNDVEKIANDLSTAQESSTRSFQYALKLVLSEEKSYGAAIVIRSDDPIEYAKTIAKFSMISQELHALLECAGPIVGEMLVHFATDNDALVEWMDHKMERHSRCIPLPVDDEASGLPV